MTPVAPGLERRLRGRRDRPDSDALALWRADATPSGHAARLSLHDRAPRQSGAVPHAAFRRQRALATILDPSASRGNCRPGGGVSDDDLVLEPSAGTGMLAVFAKNADARLALNELAETRRALLGHLFPEAVVSDHNAASIDDRLDRSITPSVIVMNPPFSAANHVEGRFRQATSQHVLSALARLAPGGRLVVITGESFRPSTKSFQSTFQRIGQSADVVFSAAIDGKVFARHGTTIDTRLTVIDKRAAGAEETALVKSEAAYHPICATTADLLSVVLAHCRERRSPHLAPPARPSRSLLNRPAPTCTLCATPPVRKLAHSPKNARSTRLMTSRPPRSTTCQKPERSRGRTAGHGL